MLYIASAYTLAKDDFIQSFDRKAKVCQERRRSFLPQNIDLQITSSSSKKIQNALEANIIVHMTQFEQYSSLIRFKRQPKYTIVLNSSIFTIRQRQDSQRLQDFAFVLANETKYLDDYFATCPSS